ncbi:MAG: aryl-sulfate sulfotransferase [Clostridiales bacterium]|nr:aryl-sulfate sulfotransferase [Clostridiales bacterium]
MASKTKRLGQLSLIAIALLIAGTAAFRALTRRETIPEPSAQGPPPVEQPQAPEPAPPVQPETVPEATAAPLAEPEPEQTADSAASLDPILGEILSAVRALATPTPEPEPTPDPNAPIDGFQEILRYVYEQIEKQASVDADLLSELDSGAYTFSGPLIVVDPYGYAPLTAAAAFETAEPSKISVLVQGKTPAADIAFEFDEYRTKHIVPIYGLYADKLNTVTLTAVDKSGRISVTSVEIRTDALPERLAKFVITTYAAQPDKYSSGLNFSSVNKYAYDINGDYRWIINDRGAAVTYWNYSEGTYICPMESANQSLLVERNTLGKYLRLWYAPSGGVGIHHDIEEMPGGNLLLTTSSAGSGIIVGDTCEDVVLELDAQTGEIVNYLDFIKILQRFRMSLMIANEAGVNWDWLHMNKVTYHNGSIVISSRHQSTVAKVTWPQGDIEWILGSHYAWSPYWQQFLLTPTGDNFEWQHAQHFPIVLPDFDENPDTEDIMLFDNGNQRFAEDFELQRQIQANEAAAPENYSRIVHYRIDEKAMTVEQVWQYGKERGAEWFASRCGNVALLDNGSRIGSCIIESGAPPHSILSEVSESGELVWEAYTSTKDAKSTLYEYRAYREPLYRNSDNDLRVGESTINLVPRDILMKYGFITEEGD